MGKKKPSRKCLFCRSTTCYYRIATASLDYDELACTGHTKELEVHADEWGTDVMKFHITSSYMLNRGTSIEAVRVHVTL